MAESQNTSHTLEFHQRTRHDKRFNNIEKTRRESLYAAAIIRNPGHLYSIVHELSLKLLSVVNRAATEGEYGELFIDELEMDIGRPGQLAAINNINELKRILIVRDITPVSFCQKILAIKSFGAYIVNYAKGSYKENRFIFGSTSASQLETIFNQYNKPELFIVRGRGNIRAQHYRADLGIMDKDEFERLSKEDKSRLRIPGLSSSRPMMRTFTHVNGEKSPFISRTFRKDHPLIGAASGATICMMLAAHILLPTITESQRQDVAHATAAFLVAGGYHSLTEVFDVAFPDFKFY